MPSPSTIIYSHTHWDRAWYAPFELFRHKLVEHLDEVITHLESHPDYRHYTLDGQTSMLEDYLDVRPQQRSRLAALVRQGRLEIGPWYVQPDCFSPSGESLIRNLLRGRAQGLAFGAVMQVGYLPDSFGFPSQLPTILDGFGIDSMIFSRGMVPAVDDIGCEFIWMGAGTAQVLCLWMPQGYGHGCNLGYVTWWGDPRRQDFNPAHGVERIRDNIAKHQAYSRSGVTVVPNGVDHSPLEPGIPLVVAAASQALPDQRISHGTLRSYVDAVVASGVPLERYRGELCSAAKGVTLQGVHSARLYLKQQNQLAESLLERWAEPLVALDHLLAGGRDQRPLLRHTWKILLQNHPHDDICGCSVDAVHRDNEARSLAVRDVASTIRREAAITLGQHLDFSACPGIPLVVYNPHAFAIAGPVAIDLFLEDHEQPLQTPSLRAANGRPVPATLLERSPYFECWVRAIGFKRTRLQLLAMVDLPPCGWTTLYVEHGAPSEAATQPALPLATVDGLENEFYRLHFRADGSFDLTVKALSRTFSGLHRFEDQADRGDEYDFCPSEDPGLLRDEDIRATVTTHADGLVATAHIRTVLMLPECLEGDRGRRSATIVAQPLLTIIRLYAGSPRIEFSTSGENQLRDHRLRVLFPSRLAGDHHHVEEAFAVVTRPDRIVAGPGWGARPTATAHQKSFVSVDDGSAGLTVINRGLSEYQVLPDRAIALTLLRCVGNLSRGDLSTRAGHSGPDIATPEAQCLRPFRCDYALVAHPGDWRTAGIWRQAQAFTAPVWSFRGDEMLETDSRHFDDPQLSARITFTPPPRAGSLPDHMSMVSISDDGIVLSALKLPESGDGLLARVYSLMTSDLTTDIVFGRTLSRAVQVDLAERPLRDLPVVENRVRVPIPAGDVVSLIVYW